MFCLELVIGQPQRKCAIGVFVIKCHLTLAVLIAAVLSCPSVLLCTAAPSSLGVCLLRTGVRIEIITTFTVKITVIWSVEFVIKRINCNVQTSQSISYKLHNISKNMIHYKQKIIYAHNKWINSTYITYKQIISCCVQWRWLCGETLSEGMESWQLSEKGALVIGGG